MAALSSILTDIFAQAFESCGFGAEFGQVVASQRTDLGQFQCNGALAVAHRSRQKPRQVAEAVIARLDGQLDWAEVSIAGPGFINITVADKFLAAHLQAVAQDERLGCPTVATPKRIVIDFGGPNVAKPMHVGHLRSTIIGDCLQRLGRFSGHQVTSDIHLGDWGTQMGMLICELECCQPDLLYFEATYTGPYPQESPVTMLDLQEMYPQAVARCQADEREMARALRATVELQQGRAGYRALWQHFVHVSKVELKADFDKLGVAFDCWFGESDYHDRIPALLEELQTAGQVQLSAGAVVIPMMPTGEYNGVKLSPPDPPKGGEKSEISPSRELEGPEPTIDLMPPTADRRNLPPLILVKSDGGFLYGTTDLATLAQRVNDFQADIILYVVDARQSLHFQQVFQAAYQIGLVQDTTLRHIAFGTVNGPDGKPFKTRAGGTMQLKELISLVIAEASKRLVENNLAVDYVEAERLDIAQKVGLAALKFADLINHRASDYSFDLEKFTKFEGRTGPTLLYTAVRIKSILRLAAAQSLNPGPLLPPTSAERELMLCLAQLPAAMDNALDDYLPHHLAEFAYHLAQLFNCFYNQCHILSEADAALQGSWLTLAGLCLAELELLLSLLGIELPDRM